MKKVSILILLLAFFSFQSTDAAAQGWLKKLGKEIDKAGRKIDKEVKKLDEALNSETEGTESQNTNTRNTQTVVSNTSTGITQDYRGVKIKSFSPQVAISIESCIRDGDIVKIAYRVKNNGDKLSLSGIGTRRTISNPDDETSVYDDSGNTYEIEYHSLGAQHTYGANGKLSILLTPNVPLKGLIEIRGVSPRAKSFSLVNIVGFNDITSFKYEVISYSFTNLPIYNIEDVLRGSIVKKVDRPYTEKKTEQGSRIESVIVTNDYTRLEMSWTNGSTSQSSLYLRDPDQAYIETGGRKYKLIDFSSIARRYGEVYVPGGSMFTYSLTFERIPDNTESFSMFHDGWNFYGVRMVPASSVE